MAGRCLLIVLLILSATSCAREEHAGKQARKPAAAPTVILKPKPKVLDGEQRKELGFPDDIISHAEAAAECRAEPFFEQVQIRSSNLKGDVMITTGRLSGFSVRTRMADEVISSLSRELRSQGFLIFRSEQNFGNVPDVVTVVRGNSSYDILRIQQTESQHYNLTTKAITKWLREKQDLGSFVVTGAGADWVEARFIRPPRNMKAFAAKVAAFAPDVLREGPSTVDKLAAEMIRQNGFRLVWD